MSIRVKIFTIFFFWLLTIPMNLNAQEAKDSVDTAILSPDTTITNNTTQSIISGPVINPVDTDDGRKQVILHYYDKHGNPLQTPVLFLEEDTVKKANPKPVFPIYSGTEIGFNFGDAIMMAFGQKYGSYDLRAAVSIYNWFFPTIEFGLGFANNTPDNQNYTYKTKPSFYTKIGLDYNFLYKSNRRYRLFIGFRAGWSTFNYDLYGVTITSEYWDQTQKFDMRNLKSTAIWGEALAGLRVNIVSGFSLGWEVRWHFPFQVTDSNGSKPWFIPGYGTGNFGLSVAATWTFGGQNNKKRSDENGETPKD